MAYSLRAIRKGISLFKGGSKAVEHENHDVQGMGQLRLAQGRTSDSASKGITATSAV
jgi:hypothetical protein